MVIRSSKALLGDPQGTLREKAVETQSTPQGPRNRDLAQDLPFRSQKSRKKGLFFLTFI